MQPFGRTRHGPKIGERGSAPFLGGELGPHLTQRRLAEAYRRTKWHLDPRSRLAATDMGRTLGAPSPFGEGAPGSHLTQSPLC